MDHPISESSVSMKLAAIQKRCMELMEESGDSLELTLADADEPGQDPDRYSLQR
jgi:hypothetical protein